MLRTQILGLLVVAAGLHAGVIVDQSDYNSSQGVISQVFGGSYVASDSYLLDDFALAAATTLDSITIYFQQGNEDLGSSGTATLNEFAASGSVPSAGDDPTTGSTVDVTYSQIDGVVYSATASGLDLDLGAGSYWIGLTLNLDYDTYGQVFQYTTTSATNGNLAAWINPGGAQDAGTSWQSASAINPEFGDAAMLITGELTEENGPSAPEPATLALSAGALLALGFLRRKK